MPSTRRTRRIPFFIGVSLEQWRSDKERLEFAQRNALFKEIVSVVHHESPAVILTAGGCSGERAFGRTEGYQMAIAVLKAMAERPDRPVPFQEPTFDSSAQPQSQERA